MGPASRTKLRHVSRGSQWSEVQNKRPSDTIPGQLWWARLSSGRRSPMATAIVHQAWVTLIDLLPCSEVVSYKTVLKSFYWTPLLHNFCVCWSWEPSRSWGLVPDLGKQKLPNCVHEVPSGSITRPPGVDLRPPDADMRPPRGIHIQPGRPFCRGRVDAHIGNHEGAPRCPHRFLSHLGKLFCVADRLSPCLGRKL